MPALSLRGLTKTWGATTSVRNLSCEIADGEFVVLVGPSGCGKSTLLRMIAGLESITAGDLYVDGRRFNDIAPQKRNVAMVFQSYALFPHMSVRGNIAFGPQVRREADITARVQQAAELLNLTAVLDKKPAQLSGGQRQRVAMGRAIVRNVQIFLFDEPLSNLDAKLRVQMRTEIKSLYQKFKPTVVYVTHDQIEAMTMADRIVVMNAGTIEQIGPPLEVYDNPCNRFVASFIGAPTMEMCAGRILRNGAGCAVELQDGRAIPIRPCALRPGHRVDIAVRPENYVVAADGPLLLKVAVMEPTGPETHIFGTIADNPVRIVTRERIDIQPGQQLQLNAQPRHIFVFDRASGRRIV